MSGARRRPVHAVRFEQLQGEANWTDAEVAAAAGISSRTVENIRLGRHAKIRPATASVVAGAFSTRLGREITGAFLRGVHGDGPRSQP